MNIKNFIKVIKLTKQLNMRKYIFDKIDVVESALENSYNPEYALGMEFGTYKELEIDELHSHHEFWFGGKCVAIEYGRYKELLSEGLFE